jgi:hypothetical protein
VAAEPDRVVGRLGSGVFVFERFTDRARRVVVLAQEEARLLDHNYIGTEHILLGLIHEGQGVAAQALESLGVSLARTRAHVEEIIGHGSEAPAGHVPFTPRAKKVLEMSLREALQLGHNYIGTEHLLLGLIREGEGVAAQVLVTEGVELSRARQAVIQLLAGYPQTPPGTGPGAGSTTGFAAAGSRNPAFGVDVPERRCPFCLRSEERVTRLVRGRGAWICDECVARAVELVAGAAESGERRVRLRPRRVIELQPEEAEAAIELAFETVFGGDASASERLALIEDSDALADEVERLMVVRRRVGDPDVWVDAVRFLSTDEAEVHWSPALLGGGRATLNGFAVLDGDVWKVGHPTFRRVTSMAGIAGFAEPAARLPEDPAAHGGPPE